MQISVRLFEMPEGHSFERIRTILAVAANNYQISLGINSEVILTIGIEPKLQANDFRIFLESQHEKRLGFELLEQEAWKIFGGILHGENHFSFYYLSLPVAKTKQPAMA